MNKSMMVNIVLAAAINKYEMKIKEEEAATGPDQI